MDRTQRAFTLVELLVVIGIIAVLTAITLPTLRKVRKQSEQTVCSAQLAQVGAAILMYVNENSGRLPMVIEPLWKPDGTLDWNADPRNADLHPHAFLPVMQKYLKDSRVLICPGAVMGYPRLAPAMTYRVSSANNFDGVVRTEDQLIAPNGSPSYTYSLKYLNGRKYKLKYVESRSFPLKLQTGVGPFYLVRDFVERDNGGTMHPPHGKNYNQLRLDLSVSVVKDDMFGFTHP